jgi:hypothetical protein
VCGSARGVLVELTGLAADGPAEEAAREMQQVVGAVLLPDHIGEAGRSGDRLRETMPPLWVAIIEIGDCLRAGFPLAWLLGDDDLGILVHDVLLPRADFG